MPQTLQIHELYTRDVLGSTGLPEEQTPADSALEEDRLRTVMLELLGTLATGVSREFQAGLQAILDHTLRLKSRLDMTTAAFGELLAIETGARRLLQTSTLLQDLSRRHSPPEALDCNEIIRETLSLVQTCRGGRPGFLMELEPSLPRIQGHRTLLAHALMTLFLKSAREMPHGGTIRVRTGRVGPVEAEGLGLAEAYEGAIWVAIKDESAGFSFDRKEQICQALSEGFRSEDSEIAFLQEVSQRHTGLVLLESQPGRGTIWTMYFPALASCETEICLDIPTEVTAHKGTILLVDDEPLICGVGRRVLETGGYRVITALSGVAAIDAYRRHIDEVDLVLLDVILPDQSGLEVLKSIRGMNKAARVLMSSGYTTESGIQEMLTETGTGFIQKPYRIRELLAKVEEALEKRG